MKRVCVLVVTAVLLTSGVHASLTQAFSSDADTYIRDSTVRGGYAFMDVRGNYAFTGYVRFDLSGLNAAEIESASLTLTVSGGASRNDVLTTGRFALAGLNDVAGNTPQNWDESTLATGTVGSEWASPHPLNTGSGRLTNLDMGVASITETLNPSSGSATPGTTITVTGQSLIDFLQGRVDDTGLVTFLIAFPDGSDRGYGLASKENSNESYRPVLEVTYIPEPATMVLLGLGGLLAIRSKRG